MNGYIGFYDGKQFETHSETLFGAKQNLIKELKLKKNQEYKLSVYLCEKNGEKIYQSTCF